MASSSGNSSGSTQLQNNNSGSEEDLQHVMDERKRKRMQSNRESARRSRMRKQQHLDDLMGQVTQLRKQNSEILTSINITTQHMMTVESENSVLRAQLIELSQRLHSLNDILNFINNSSSSSSNEVLQCETTLQNSVMNPWNLLCGTQPIMAMLQY